MRASDRAYGLLFHEIVNGDLSPGTVLAEVEQSNRLGVSRTPLREAISRLVADGLVVAAPGRGAVVTDVSLENVTELYELREALEDKTVRLAARRRNREVFVQLECEFGQAGSFIEGGDEGIRKYYGLNERFDLALDEAAANRYIAQALRNVRVHLSRVRRLAKDNPERLLQSAVETNLIIQAIIAGDADLAAHATHVHLHQSLNHVLRSMGGTVRSIAVA